MDHSRGRSRSRSTRRSKTPSRRSSVPPDVRISRAYVNPFFNFLADCRKSNTQGLNMRELTLKGAKLWREMSEKEKLPYIKISEEVKNYRSASRKRRRSKRSRRRRRGGRSRRRSMSSDEERSRSRHRQRKLSKSKREEDETNAPNEDVTPASDNQKHEEVIEEVKRPDDVSLENFLHPRISYDSIRRDYI
nr:unnamed protein product [Callosobruchus chinensis]